MKQRTILVLGLALILLGAGGLLLVPILGGQFTVPDGFSSNGQRIYYTGVSASGPISRVGVGSGMMSGRVCVDCHGEDGHGGSLGMMNRVVVPDIRYSALSAAHTEEGTTTPGWTDVDIARAIRDGIEPNGQALKPPMQRWDMSDADMADVIGYLKELSSR